MKQRNGLKYLAAAVGFALLFAFYYFLDQESFKAGFLEALSKVPSIRDFGGSSPATTVKFFVSNGPLIVIGLSVLAWLVSLVLLGILKLFRLAKYSLANFIVLLLVYGAYLALATELVFYERRYSVATIGTIFFVGQPLLSASFGMIVLLSAVYVLSLVLRIFRKKKTPPPSKSSGGSGLGLTEELLPHKAESEVKEKEPEKVPVASLAVRFLLISSLCLMSEGCSLFGSTQGLACALAPDSAHCFQDQAVSEGDPSICEKVVQPEKFKELGSNPPKDKCYLMVAENTGNLDACDKIQGGPMSHSREECIIDTSVQSENPSGCQKLTGDDKAKCMEQLGPLITPDKVLAVDDQMDIIKNELKKGSDPNLEKQLAGLEQKRKDMLAVMTQDNKDKYGIESDPINKQIVSEWSTGGFDGVTKDKLIALNEKLKASGATMTAEQFNAVRDYYKFVNDPNNNIETMDDAQIVKPGFGDKVGTLVDKLKFWRVKDTPEEKQEDQQLRFYQKMLERQEAIDKGLSMVEMKYENTKEKVIDKAMEFGMDKAKEKVIEEMFGEGAALSSKASTMVLGLAINEVKREAQSDEFRGLVKAYNDGMSEELSRAGGNVDKASEAVAKKLTADPYTYANGDSFAKYGNLIENKDCDGSNPHCLNKEIFWKAMKKSYKYQHQPS